MRGRWWIAVVVVWSLGASVLAAGYVQIVAAPGVEVYVDDLLVGVTDESVDGLLLRDVAPGDRRLRFVLAGFEPREVTVTVVEGRVVVHELVPFEPPLRIEETGPRETSELRLLTGTLVVQSLPVAAEIDVPSLGLAAQRKTRDVWTLEQVPAGVHEVVVEALGRSVRTEVAVVDGQVTRLFAFLGADPPSVEVVERPGDVVTITQVAPERIRASDERQTIQVVGVGFLPTSAVTLYWGERAFPIPADRVTFVDAGRLDVLAALFPADDDWGVMVQNPGGVRAPRFRFSVVD